jgi:hypothetical protein
MFGGKKQEVPTRVGAREKIRKARELAASGKGAHIESQREGGKGGTKPGLLVLVCYIMGCALAFVLTQGPLKDGTHLLSVGIDGLDRILFGNGNQNFFGDPMIDLGILCLIRGLFITLVAGILPFCTLLWIRLRDDASINPFMAFWSVSIGLVLAVMACIQYVFPFMAEFFKTITT